MRSLFALLTLTACGVDATPDAIDPGAYEQMPVAPGFPAFVVSSVAGGQTMRMTYADLTPGNLVFFGVSRRDVGGLCPPTLNGDCLDIGPQGVNLLGSTGVNGNGYATFTTSVPTIGNGVELFFQAVEFDALGTYVGKSAVASRQTGPGVCPAIFAPVCGVDGVEYSNSCVSESTGWPVEIDGPCP